MCPVSLRIQVCSVVHELPALDEAVLEHAHASRENSSNLQIVACRYHFVVGVLEPQGMFSASLPELVKPARTLNRSISLVVGDQQVHKVLDCND